MFFALMLGGVLGLTPVATGRWGGLPLGPGTRTQASASKRATHGFCDCGVVLRRRDLEVDDENALLGQALR